MRAPLLFAALLLLLATAAGAADSDVQLWSVVALHHGLGERWGTHLTMRVRVDDDASNANDFLLRSSVSWMASETLTLDLGYDYLPSFDDGWEHRPWQAVEHRIAWRELDLRNRVRLDQRFFDDVGGAVLRFRHRLRGRQFIAGSQWYGGVSNEVFVNLNNRGRGPVSGFEQNRLRFALGGPLHRRLWVESGYEWHYVERRGNTGQHRHVLFVEFSIDTGGLPLFPWSPR